MSVPDPAGDAQVAIAHATLGHGAMFLAGGPGRAGWSGDPVQARMLGNGLRELDRFLSVLIDATVGRRLPAADAARLERTRNTANKLRLAHRRLGLPPPDRARWLALGRSRDCLFHTAGRITRGNARASRVMTQGWPERDDGPGRDMPLGALVSLDGADVAWICRYYAATAARIVARAGGDPTREA